MRYNTLEEGMNLTVYSNDEGTLILASDDGSRYEFEHDSSEVSDNKLTTTTGDQQMTTNKIKADSGFGWNILQRLSGANAHEAQPILDSFDFSTWYPIVDENGSLTGDLCDGIDSEGYTICDCDENGISALDCGKGTASMCAVANWRVPSRLR